MTQGPDYGQFQVGASTQPLPTSSENSLLRDADPALFYFLDFLTYVINTYPGPRLIEALTSAGIRMPGGNVVPPSAVAQAYPYEPLPQQLENQFQFPLLCVYRKEVDTEWHSIGYEHDITNLGVLYVLPPMDAAGTEQIIPIFKTVASALRRKTTDAWDPGYAPPGGNLGDQFSSALYANVEEIGFGEYGARGSRTKTRMGVHGFLESAGNLYFPCLRLNAYVVERDMNNPTLNGPSKFDGADINLSLDAEDGTSVPNVVQVSVQRSPTITGLSVTSGPVAGGTTVVITGTLFLSGPPHVYFGPSTAPQYAASVTYTTSTSVTVTTPAMQGAGPVDVTLTNRDGQTATLPQSFTFT
jgi:IPT/TIG domain